MPTMTRGTKGVIKSGTKAKVRGEDRTLTIHSDALATFVADRFPPGDDPGQGMILVSYGSLQVYVPGDQFELPK